MVVFNPQKVTKSGNYGALNKHLSKYGVKMQCMAQAEKSVHGYWRECVKFAP
jgi:hypothetical protein